MRDAVESGFDRLKYLMPVRAQPTSRFLGFFQLRRVARRDCRGKGEEIWAYTLEKRISIGDEQRRRYTNPKRRRGRAKSAAMSPRPDHLPALAEASG
jgi:hypothetical protein